MIFRVVWGNFLLTARQKYKVLPNVYMQHTYPSSIDIWYVCPTGMQNEWASYLVSQKLNIYMSMDRFGRGTDFATFSPGKPLG